MKKLDWALIIDAALIIIIGLIFLTSSSSYESLKQFGDALYYVKHQLVFGFLAGLVIFGLVLILPYSNYKKIAFGLLIFGLASLVLVFTPLGFKSGGATRWLQIGSFIFQPVELFKVLFVIYLAFWANNFKKLRRPGWESLIPFTIIIAASAFLVLLQPNTSGAFIILAAALAIYFVSGAKFSYISTIAVIGLVALGFLLFSTPYRLARLTTFFNPEADPLGSGYHINQALTALGSGGFMGVGFGQSTTKFQFLPEPMTDSVFAIIGEESGFIGTIILILLILYLVFRMLQLSKKINDGFGKYLIVGFATVIGFQSFLNIGAISGIIPFTGVPLPFISYGSSALIANLAMLGITLNVVKYN